MDLVPNPRDIWKAIIQATDRVINPDCPQEDSRPRILHLHVRKTAGTSFNFGFLSQMTDNVDAVYQKTAHKFLKCSQTRVGRYCAWDPALAEAGRYTFCHTHSPIWQFKIPKNIFVVTILRDPLARLSSLHNMLGHLLEQQRYSRVIRQQRKLFRYDFNDFLEALPDEELLGQLYKFSRNMNLHEATDNLRLHVNLVGNTKEYGKFVTSFNAMTNYRLPVLHVRQGRGRDISYGDLPSNILDKLSMEKEFVDAATF